VTPLPQSQPAGLVLNEVRFAPVAGEAAFVEVANAGSSPVDLAGVVLRIGRADLPLGGASALPAGARLLVLFDGLDSVEGTVVHAAGGLGLPPDHGSVELLDPAGARLDRVAWCDTEPDAGATGPGGIVAPGFKAGTSIGRAPGALDPGTPEDWVVYPAEDATAGNANPEPAVSVLLPLSGAMLDRSAADLFWYPVPGGSSYRVQVDTDPAFASPDLDTSATDPQLNVAALAPGAYLWRVQAIAADGTASRFSEPADFERAPDVVGAAADTEGKHLPVPLIAQHKDTAMLLLERNVETGAHPWDEDHKTFDSHDPADNMNCALASVAMISAFFGGDLSQDRIGYEVLQHRGGNPAGPEGDLVYGDGIGGEEASEAFRFALGGVTEGGLLSFAETWTRIVSEIDAGRPVGIATLSHVFVVTGYEVTRGRRFIDLNDPWPGRTYPVDIDHIKLPPAAVNIWLMPANPTVRKQEASVTTDTDGDGVVDFDEMVRFETNPTGKDSDGDELADKDDVRSGVFDPKYGYAGHRGSPFGRDYDSDGLPTELDPDSDEGGCLDGREDVNQNGHRDDPETWNFDGDDDRCSGWRGTITSKWGARNGEWTGSLTATVVFEPDPRPVNSEWFIVTSGSATWKETGTEGPTCTREGGGTFSLVQPGDEEKDDPQARAAFLRIWDGGEEGLLRYAGQGLYRAAEGQELRVTITCEGAPPGGTTTMANLWFAVISDLEPPPQGYFGESSLTFPKDANSFSGSSAHTIEGWTDQTWTWTFTRMGH
jgi:hypothetical protein